MTARFARDRDRDARALRFELHSTRTRLYRALTLLAPFLSVGSVEHDAIYPVRTQMPIRVAWPEVGGIIPLGGPLLPPYTGPRPHPCSNGYQGPQATCFPMRILSFQDTWGTSMRITTEMERMMSETACGLSLVRSSILVSLVC